MFPCGNDTAHCWEFVFLWGKTCYVFYLSEFCTRMLSVLRSHLSFFALHMGNLIPEVSKVISYYFFFSNIIWAQIPFWLDFKHEVLQLKPQADTNILAHSLCPRMIALECHPPFSYFTLLVHIGCPQLPWIISRNFSTQAYLKTQLHKLFSQKPEPLTVPNSSSLTSNLSPRRHHGSQQLCRFLRASVFPQTSPGLLTFLTMI